MDLCTPWLIVNIVLFAAGLWILVKGSDIFVDSASDLARCWNVSELVIGLTLVSIGTSLPELASSVYAAFCNQPDFIVGNIVGSNITNITLILGAGAAFSAKAMRFNPKLLSRDTVLMNLVFFVTAAMILLGKAVAPDGTVTRGIDRIGGGILFAGCIFYCWYLFRSSQGAEEESVGKDEKKKHGIPFLLLMTVVSIFMITAGSKMLVDNVIWGALKLGIPSLFISVTIVAFGTSVPELAVTVTGVRKGCSDLALGNVIGSCVFNILMIFGITALIRPLAVAGSAGLINVTMMILTGMILGGIMFFTKKVSRWSGIFLLGLYGLFLLYNGRDAFFK